MQGQFREVPSVDTVRELILGNTRQAKLVSIHRIGE